MTVELGANYLGEGVTRFSVWSPKAKQLAIEIVDRATDGSENVLAVHLLGKSSEGIWTSDLNYEPGSLYRVKKDEKPGRPDPRSRFQPFGVHGPSEVIDPNTFEWTDEQWAGVAKPDLVIYETHIGSMTEAGTYLQAIEDLARIKDLGFTALELLPLAQTPGKWNWGYDGVNYFAPRNTFGRPDELKQFVNACHQIGLAVILDVVYNHVGPEGNYLNEIAPYRSRKFGTPWGDALDFDQVAVRQFVIDNIFFFLDEYHFDGLRLDAVHYMFDDSSKNILEEVQEEFAQFAKSLDRKVYLIGESNIYDADLVGQVETPQKDWDGVWSDCLMQSIYSVGRPDLRLTNRTYEGKQDAADSLQHGYVFAAPNAKRVTVQDRDKHHPGGDRTYLNSLIMALQTHDSVGNHPHGLRLHQLTSLEFQLAAAPLFLLYPSIPMVFMGEEIATDSPFPFFADFEDQRLRKAVDKGRRDEYPHHDWAGSPLPSDPGAFTTSRPEWNDHSGNVARWYRNLLELRRTGLREGWLDVANMNVDFDLQKCVYQLEFENESGNDIIVVARLASEEEAASLKPLSLESLGISQVLLDSRAESTQLEVPHGVVGWRR